MPPARLSSVSRARLIAWLILPGLMLLPRLPAADPAPAVSPSVPGNTAAEARPESALEGPKGPDSLKEKVRIVVDTNAPPVESGTNGPARQSGFHWSFDWNGWDGLQLEVTEEQPLGPNLEKFAAPLFSTNLFPQLTLQRVKMGAKFGAKAAVDAAGFAADDALDGFDSGAELRRARVFVEGDCLLVTPVSYHFEVGYIPNEFYIEESYMLFPKIPYLGDLKAGQFTAPMGLDLVSSSRDIAFMEPPAPLQALAPGVDAGIQVSRTAFANRMSIAGGVFTAGVGDDFGDASSNYGRAIARITGLPIYHYDAADPASIRLLHLGLAANILYSDDNTVRYRARPESHLAPYVLDTGDILADRAGVLGGEIAWIDGRLSMQSEYVAAVVNTRDIGIRSFEGLYVSAGWFLTPDSRTYDPRSGKLSRVIPRRNLHFGGGGWGAVEIGGRFSAVDLNDGDLVGGRLRMFMTGLNWYLHSHVKWRFDYGYGRVAGREPEGDFHIFQTRAEVDF